MKLLNLGMQSLVNRKSVMFKITILASALVLSLLVPSSTLGESIDIGSYFNRDTIINASGDNTSEGYRMGTHGEYFATENGSSTVSGGDNVNGDGTDIPNNGLVSFNSTKYSYTFVMKNLTNTDGTDNTILLGQYSAPQAVVTVDISDVSYDELAVLYAGVAVNEPDGKVTVSYSTGNDDVFTWDLADWGGGNVGNGAQAILGPGVDFARMTAWPHKIIDTSQGQIYAQVFGVDFSRTISSITFDTGANTGDIGIYALNGAVPEPTSIGLLVFSLGFLLRRKWEL